MVFTNLNDYKNFQKIRRMVSEGLGQNIVIITKNLTTFRTYLRILSSV